MMGTGGVVGPSLVTILVELGWEAVVGMCIMYRSTIQPTCDGCCRVVRAVQ